MNYYELFNEWIDTQSLLEIATYSFASGFLSAPLLFGGIPLFREYDFLQVILTFLLQTLFFKFNQLNSIWIECILKIVSSAVTSVLVFYCTAVLLTGIMLVIICLTLVAHISKHDLFPANNPSKHFLFIKSLHSFSLSLKAFRQLQILIILMNQVAFDFLAVLAGMGILLVSSTGYITVAMYSNKNFPFLLYLSACFIFVLGFIVCFVLITLASLPNKFGKGFILYWKNYLKLGHERRALKACPGIGFTVGMIHNVKRSTALAISDTALNFTATMVLTGRNVWIHLDI